MVFISTRWWDYDLQLSFRLRQQSPKLFFIIYIKLIVFKEFLWKFITSLSDVGFCQTFYRWNTIDETFDSRLGHSGQKSLDLRFEFLAVCC